MRTILIALGLATACGGSLQTPLPPPDPIPAEQWAAPDAAREAAAYLLRHLDKRGRFDYVRRSSVSEKKYNILRHAGSIHSLVQFHSANPSEEMADGVIRAARYLRARYVAPLPGHPELLAAISRPGEESIPAPTAKLGGTALAVIALAGARGLDSTVVSKEDLQAMGGFLLFMQKPDGSFYSKYIIDDGFDASFHSLYYPGETMLALTMLYDLDGDERWLAAALRSAAQLIESRQSIVDWPADYWMMLASLPLLERFENVRNPALTADELREHITLMGEKIMKDQRDDGHFAREPRSTPTATRLEGLIALARIQEEVDPRLTTGIKKGMRFLLRCQLRVRGASRGGMPRSCAPDASDKRRGEEIRIDDVQHFLSAVLTAP